MHISRSERSLRVVITHDDRYFHLGDRVIKLEYGKVAAVSQSDQPAETLHK